MHSSQAKSRYIIHYSGCVGCYNQLYCTTLGNINVNLGAIHLGLVQCQHCSIKVISMHYIDFPRQYCEVIVYSVTTYSCMHHAISNVLTNGKMKFLMHILQILNLSKRIVEDNVKNQTFFISIFGFRQFIHSLWILLFLRINSRLRYLL